MRFKEHFDKRVDEGIEFASGKSKASFIFFILSVVYVATMLISGFNFLVEIAPLFAIFYGIIMFCGVLKSGNLGKFNFLSYSTLMLGTFFMYLVWGADPFGTRLGYNLMLVSLAIIAIVMVVLAIRVVHDHKVQYVLTSVATVLMVASALFYTLFASIRIRPIAKNMWKGHDEYLEAVRGSVTNCNNDDSPNVLVVLMDDMAYADISAYSYLGKDNATIHTPNLDKLAEDGVMLENAYASSPVSSPSRFGIMTGRYSARGHLDNVVFQTKQQNTPFSTTRFFNPFQLGCNADGILGDEVTIAEVMKAKGYNTGLFGKWNLGDYGEYLPTQQGFDYFYGSHYINDMNPYNIVREVKDEKGNSIVTEVKDNDYRLEQSESTKTFSGELDSFISGSIDRGEKFFAEYWSPWPHFPIFSGVPGDKSDDNYIDCIEEFDTYLGKTFDMLKEKGVYDDTLIIFTSDNGPGREGVTGNHRGRKNTTFDGGHKVPFIAAYKNGGIGKGDNVRIDPSDGYKKINTPSTNVDIFPTILDYCNVKNSDGSLMLPQDRVIDGISIKSWLDGVTAEETRVHDAIYYLKRGKVEGIQMPLEATVRFSEGRELERVQTGIYNFKYYDKVHTENSAFIDQFYVNYLFNLSLDPAEGYNVAMKYDKRADTGVQDGNIVEIMRKRLFDFRHELKTNRRGIIK